VEGAGTLPVRHGYRPRPDLGLVRLRPLERAGGRVLPDAVFDRLPGGESRYPGCKEYATASEACRALLVALPARG
jgi:hypothetical protein